MSKRTRAIGVFGLLFAATLVLIVLFQHEPGVDVISASKAAAINSTEIKVSSALKAPVATTSALSSRTGEAARDRGGEGIVGLLREALGFTITDREAEVIARHYNDLVASRESVELSLAQREIVKPGTVLITIPAYYEQGFELYSEFGDQLITDLGRVRAKEIGKALDESAKANNAFFGTHEQQVLVEEQDTMFHIVHGSGFLLNINSQPRSATRTSTSNVMRDDLGGYEYLRPLFPVE